MLTCSVCGSRNYRRTRARAAGAGATKPGLSLKKFCKACNQHTVHIEAR